MSEHATTTLRYSLPLTLLWFFLGYECSEITASFDANNFAYAVNEACFEHPDNNACLAANADGEAISELSALNMYLASSAPAF